MFHALWLQWDFYPPGDFDALENVWLTALEGAVHPRGSHFNSRLKTYSSIHCREENSEGLG